MSSLCAPSRSVGTSIKRSVDWHLLPFLLSRTGALSSWSASTYTRGTHAYTHPHTFARRHAAHPGAGAPAPPPPLALAHATVRLLPGLGADHEARPGTGGVEGGLQPVVGAYHGAGVKPGTEGGNGRDANFAFGGLKKVVLRSP